MLSPKVKGHLKLLVKVAVAVCLILLVFKVTGANWDGVKDSLANLGPNWPWFVLAVVLHIPGYLLQALRWGGLLRAQGMNVRMPVLLESYLVATFFNNILPSSFGGDAMRAYDTGFRDKRGKAAEAAAVVLVDRISGLVVLMLLAVVGMFFVDWRQFAGADGKTPLPYLIATAVVFFGVLAGVVVMLQPKIAAFFLGLIHGRGKIGSKIHAVMEKVYKALVVYADKKVALLVALFWGLLHAVNVVVHYYILALALGFDVTFWRDIWGFFIAIPVIQVIQAIPVTPAGHGTGDWAHTLLVKFIKAANESAAIAMRWTFVATTLFWALIGLVLFLARVVRKRPLFATAMPASEPAATAVETPAAP